MSKVVFVAVLIAAVALSTTDAMAPSLSSRQFPLKGSRLFDEDDEIQRHHRHRNKRNTVTWDPAKPLPSHISSKFNTNFRQIRSHEEQSDDLDFYDEDVYQDDDLNLQKISNNKNNNNIPSPQKTIQKFSHRLLNHLEKLHVPLTKGLPYSPSSSSDSPPCDLANNTFVTVPGPSRSTFEKERDMGGFTKNWTRCATRMYDEDGEELDEEDQQQMELLTKINDKIMKYTSLSFESFEQGITISDKITNLIQYKHNNNNNNNNNDNSNNSFTKKKNHIAIPNQPSSPIKISHWLDDEQDNENENDDESEQMIQILNFLKHKQQHGVSGDGAF